MFRRSLEFAVLYIAAPVALTIAQRWSAAHNKTLHIPIIPVLWIIAAVALWALRHDKRFDFREFVRVRTVPRHEWLMMLARFAVGATALTLGLCFVKPEALLHFPKTRPAFWLVVMCCYPIFSVLAQGVVYRALYWNRYSRMFPERARIIIGAIIFALAHTPYANAYALAFPFIGGLMFLSGYRRTRSLAFAAIEHALYGDFLFTIGWGEFFFHAGTLRLLGG